MSGIVKVSRTIATKNRDGTWGRLDTSRCISVEGYQASAYYLVCFLHKTPNRRWYVEKFNPKDGTSKAEEVTLDEAMDWLLEHTYSKLSKLRCLEDLPDVTETPTPAHGGGIVVKCLKCRALSHLTNRSRSITETAIVETLKKAKKSLSGREISDSACLNYNSNFRSILSRLVSRSIVVKVFGKGGYALADRHLS